MFGIDIGYHTGLLVSCAALSCASGAILSDKITQYPGTEMAWQKISNRSLIKHHRHGQSDTVHVSRTVLRLLGNLPLRVAPRRLGSGIGRARLSVPVRVRRPV